MPNLKFSGIIHDSIVDGPGLRSVVFTKGCKHSCPGCHNEATWSEELNQVKNVDEIITEIKKHNFTKKVTISGGDPLLQYEKVYTLCQKLKADNYNIWLYTGYTFEQVKKAFPKILTVIDVLVVG